MTSPGALMRQALERLLERGRRARVACEDVDAQDMLIVVSAVTRAARTSPGSQAADRESRFVDVVLSGLAATAPPERT